MNEDPAPLVQRLRDEGVGELDGGEAEGGLVHQDIDQTLQLTRPQPDIVTTSW